MSGPASGKTASSKPASGNQTSTGASAAEQALVKASVRSGWLLSTPALVLLALAAVGPLLIMLVYSFLTPGEYGNVEWGFSTDAWTGILFTRDVFDDTLRLEDAHLSILWRSVKLSLMTTAFTFAVGFPTAWFIATRPQRQRGLWLFLITIPFWTNLLIRTLAINEILRTEGLLNNILIGLGLITEPIQIIYTDTAVFIGMTYVYLPLMVLPLFAAIDRFDMRLLEAGYDLYATRLQVLRRIILPVVKPGIIAGSILVFVPALGAYVTPRILGGGKQMMIGNFIELQFGQGRNWPLGASLSVTLLVIVTAALLVYVRFANREVTRG
ncbi:ABC transporter permease [Rhodobacter sp. KR11]|uniref:ABC transporter permease n=1 Tax=Rhodobacter sp. KR11 TaxID=2974588 RepID=UPI002221565A|nr:ABC transporter permease [Rhodobacter sp. KR11]MCW1920073.1 ABC transporter permease [Rhodobacter sp. KR11]